LTNFFEKFLPLGGMRRLCEIFPDLGDEKIAQLALYVELLVEWNGKINLLSRKDMGNVVLRHIVPCLSIAHAAKFLPREDVLDIGTGGGLPGIPLAIACESTNFTLLDSIRKKIMAVTAMVSALGLKNVTTSNARAEDMGRRFDKIVGRAVANFPTFFKYSRRLLKDGGRIFYLKGGDCAEEMAAFENYRLHGVGEITNVDALSDKVILEVW
jgi:16S rRNA (guanine527-N7)-methyltransferase